MSSMAEELSGQAEQLQATMSFFVVDANRSQQALLTDGRGTNGESGAKKGERDSDIAVRAGGALPGGYSGAQNQTGSTTNREQEHAAVGAMADADDQAFEVF
jgi:hypothetical protein